MDNQGNIACKTITDVWVWSRMPSHTQTYLDLLGVNLVALKVEKESFYHVLLKFSND